MSRKKQRKPRAPKAVATAEKNFDEAEDELKKFKEENEPFMKELIHLVAERERARERLLAAVSDKQFGAGGMRVKTSYPRDFDGRFLHQYLPAEIRDKIVEVTYKVDPKAFDKAVKDELIEEGLVAEAFTTGEAKVSILGKIKPISLG